MHAPVRPYFVRVRVQARGIERVRACAGALLLGGVPLGVSVLVCRCWVLRLTFFPLRCRCGVGVLAVCCGCLPLLPLCWRWWVVGGVALYLFFFLPFSLGGGVLALGGSACLPLFPLWRLVLCWRCTSFSFCGCCAVLYLFLYTVLYTRWCGGVLAVPLFSSYLYRCSSLSLAFL